MGSQLRLDGVEVPEAEVIVQAPFTRAQREILDRMRGQGFIRSREAGEIVHSYRPLANWRPEFFASDGGDAMKRLVARGLVRRGEERGLWILECR